jgi:hypothetical protein
MQYEKVYCMYDYVIILSAYVRGKYRVCTYDLITSVILTKPPTVLSFSHLVVLVVQVLYKKWARAERPNDQVIKWALNCIPPLGIMPCPPGLRLAR